MTDVPDFRPELRQLEIPDRIRRLPVDKRGYPILWFVHIDEQGVPDFRVVGRNKIAIAVHEKRCWLCGEKLGRNLAFVIGPMCSINRISSEPPSHRDCALFAVKACPFLNRPKMHRRTNDLPEGYTDPAGEAIKRNPGVALVWITTEYTILRVDNGVLFEVGEPEEWHWFAEGRDATRQEVKHSIDTGFPLLLKEAEKQGREGVQALLDQTTRSFRYLPEEKLVLAES